MSEQIKKHFHLLHFLCECKQVQRKILVSTLNREQINAICECVDNYLAGNISTSTVLRKKLLVKKAILRKLRSKKTALRDKRRLLVQHGGFLPTLLIPILSVASSILGSLIG